MDITAIISHIHHLPESSLEKLMAETKEIAYPRGSLVMSTARVEENIFFIKKGIVRAYANVGDDEVTFWFGKEGDTALSIMSYVALQKSYENIETLEDCIFYQLKTATVKSMFETDLDLANWGRKMMEKELVKTEERLIAMQCKSARGRYEELIEFSPDLLQRVKLTHLASYLGITLVSLSRIRADLGK
jgi:CRP-like cAMP-binding protein